MLNKVVKKLSQIDTLLFFLMKKVLFIFKPSKKTVQNTILVVGSQRSGTNLLMDVLERNLLSDVYHETDPRAFQHYEMKPLDDILLLKQQSPAFYFVIKGLCESQKTDSLLKSLSPAKAIWVVRDYNDVINSMDISFKSTLDVFKRIAVDKSAGAWRTECMSEQTYAKIKPLIHDQLTNQSASALHWYIRNILFFEKSFDLNDDIKVLNYNYFVSNPLDALNQISQFTGLPVNSFMSKIINLGSIKKNKQPEIDEEIRQLCEELWLRFVHLAKEKRLDVIN